MIINSFQTIINYFFDDSAKQAQQKLRSHHVSNSWLFLPAVHWLYYSPFSKGLYWTFAIAAPLTVSALLWSPLIAIITLPAAISALMFIGYEAKQIESALNSIEISERLVPISIECARIEEENRLLHQMTEDIERGNMQHDLNDPTNWHLTSDQKSLEKHIKSAPKNLSATDTLTSILHSANEEAKAFSEEISTTSEKVVECSNKMIQARLSLDAEKQILSKGSQSLKNIEQTNQKTAYAVCLNLDLSTQLSKELSGLREISSQLNQRITSTDETDSDPDSDADSVDSYDPEEEDKFLAECVEFRLKREKNLEELQQNGEKIDAMMRARGFKLK